MYDEQIDAILDKIEDRTADLNAKADQASSFILATEERLKGCAVQLGCVDGFGYGKINGRWGFTYKEDTLLLQAPRSIRISAIRAIPAILSRILKILEEDDSKPQKEEDESQ